MYKLNDIKHETPNYWVLSVTNGYEVYKKGLTHSTRCAIIGYSNGAGLKRAIKECNKREQK